MNTVRPTQTEVARESLRAVYLRHRRLGQVRPLESYLPREDDPAYDADLIEVVAAELFVAWRSWADRRGETHGASGSSTVAAPPPLESYCQRFPRLRQPLVLSRVVGEEIRVRLMVGDRVDRQEYERRFPQAELTDDAFRPPALVPCETEYFDPELTRASGGAPIVEARTLPCRFGNYELLSVLGSGGMGVVYRARQLSADRLVALKLIRRDRLAAATSATHTSAIDRFRHEAQAAARLEHDHIVTVYEVGEIGDEHFYSMRLVDGTSLVEMVRGGPLDARVAAGYLEPVSRALAEAHRQRILHRDLKPHNILVDRRTNRALVADFGLAKLAEGQEELTRAGEVMGTPAYMSPEQASDSSQVGAASDIYALGATLYHLITGRPPFQASTAVETMRQVLDEEPAPPRQVNPSVDRDVETICLKCLDKDPARRYATAGELADDLARYLRGEPILARPIGRAQRLVRWCRRHPIEAALAGSSLALLVAALSIALVGYVQVRSALAVAEANHRRYEQSFRQAREVVDYFFTSLSEDKLLNQPGMQPVRQELLERALVYYQGFLQERAGDDGVAHELAETHFRVGHLLELLGQPERALASFDAGRTIGERLLAGRTDPSYLEILGNTYNAQGRVYHQLHRWDDAAAAHGRAIDVRQRWAALAGRNAAAERAVANSRMNLGLMEKDRSRLDAARAHLEQAQLLRGAILEKHPADVEVQRDLGMGYFNLGHVAMLEENAAAAGTNFRAAAKAFEAALATHTDDIEDAWRLATCERLLADVESFAGDDAQAERLYASAAARLGQLAQANPDVPRYQMALAELHMNQGLNASAGGALEAAAREFHAAVTIYERLATAVDATPRAICDLAVALTACGEVDADLGHADTARSQVERACAALADLVKRHPENAAFADELKTSEALLASLEPPATAPAETQVTSDARSDGRARNE